MVLAPAERTQAGSADDVSAGQGVLGRLEQAAVADGVAGEGLCVAAGGVLEELGQHGFFVDVGGGLLLGNHLGPLLLAHEVAQLLQLLEDLVAELLPVGGEVEARLVVARVDDLAGLGLVALCSVPGAHVDTSFAFVVALWADELARPVAVAEVLQGVVDVIQVLREDGLGGTCSPSAEFWRHETRHAHL